MHNNIPQDMASTTKHNAGQDRLPTRGGAIALIGLGIMGRAVARAYSEAGMTVHAWNRGQANKTRTRELNLNNVVVHDDLSDALERSDGPVLMMVLADRMLATAESVIRSVDGAAWRGKTLVQFTSHEPFAIKAQEELVASSELGASLIGGAMMAVPATVGTDAGVFLVSSKDPALVQRHLPSLKALGTVVSLDGGDTGLAALADIGLLQGLQFGLAGNELSCLMFERYGVDQQFKDAYVDLIAKATIPIFRDLSKEACDAIFRGNFDDQAGTYTAAGHRAVYEAHQYFFERMGLRQSTYLTAYLEQFRKVERGSAVGPSAIVKTYAFSEATKN